MGTVLNLSLHGIPSPLVSVCIVVGDQGSEQDVSAAVIRSGLQSLLRKAKPRALPWRLFRRPLSSSFSYGVRKTRSMR